MDSKEKIINLYSDFDLVKKRADMIYGPESKLQLSPLKNKKYRIWDYISQKWVDFGQMGMMDFTKHKDLKRRERYLRRALNIKGDWAADIYSPNSLSITLLWVFMIISIML